jgi:hypothetical protein
MRSAITALSFSDQVLRKTAKDKAPTTEVRALVDLAPVPQAGWGLLIHDTEASVGRYKAN